MVVLIFIKMVNWGIVVATTGNTVVVRVKQRQSWDVLSAVKILWEELMILVNNILYDEEAGEADVELKSKNIFDAAYRVTS